jgi:ADP-ribose pyrophosphatase YjhB (NUDIX family)
MSSVTDNPRFGEAYRRLADISLNPRRHTAAHAHAHAEAVAARGGELARANGCPPDEVALLEDLGRVHDIGKITGTAKPEKSLEVLRDCGITDARLLALVKWHDTNLPWFLSAQKGQPPSDKAWRRLAGELDLRLLALFMVADRVDAPPGWRRNAPLAWFLGEARRRGLVPALVLDLPGHASEISAGCALGDGDGDGGGGGGGDGDRILLIRVRAEGYELPKGGIEWDELPEEAALRELREEAAVTSPVELAGELGHLDYELGEGADRHTKRVRYFRVRPVGGGSPELGPLPPRTHERRWVTRAELAEVPLVSEELRRILLAV